MSKYAIFLYAAQDSISSDVEDSEHDDHRQHADELQDEGIVLAAFALESYETATSIRADGVTDGPFIEAKEVVLGVYVIEAKDLDAALTVAKRNPIIRQGGGVEVRPIEDLMVKPTAEK